MENETNSNVTHKVTVVRGFNFQINANVFNLVGRAELVLGNGTMTGK